MTAISYATAVDPRKLPFKDRRTSLKVVGVLLVIFGALSGCFGVLAPVGLYVSVMFAGGAGTAPGQGAGRSRAGREPKTSSQRPRILGCDRRIGGGRPRLRGCRGYSAATCAPFSATERRIRPTSSTRTIATTAEYQNTSK